MTHYPVLAPGIYLLQVQLSQRFGFWAISPVRYLPDLFVPLGLADIDVDLPFPVIKALCFSVELDDSLYDIDERERNSIVFIFLNASELMNCLDTREPDVERRLRVRGGVDRGSSPV